ncbi:MAG: tetratricopeptide repeat protein [Planctomycetes bacterium]|nr:tetratricopeptide repeat protein [Planctomycetota bacterium]
MHRIAVLTLLACAAILPAMDLVDDPVYRRMAASLEAKPGRTPNDDLRLAGIFSDARQYDQSEALYRKHLDVADHYPLIYANLSVFAGKQGKYAEAIAWADQAISATRATGGDTLHPTLVKASWLWEIGRQEEAKALFASVPVPPVGDRTESTYWGCRACFYGSVGDQTELAAAIAKCLDLGDEHFITFVRRDVVFDRYRSQPWFIALVGVTIRP